MIRNYFVITIRNIRKHLAFSLINVAGLGLGLATSLLLIAWVKQEISFDRFLRDADQIYRVSFDFNFGGQLVRTALSPSALLPSLEENFGEVNSGTRIYNPSSYDPYILSVGDDRYQESKFYFVDSSFLDVFSYRLIQGNRRTVLKAPYSVVLTRSTARKYFGKENPIGRTLSLNSEQDYTVTGVAEDPPGNSYLQFDFLASFSSLHSALTPVWWSSIYQTFIALKDPSMLTELKSKTDTLIHKSYDFGMTDPNDYVRSRFIALPDIHLHSDLFGELESVGDIQYVYIFSGIAALTLLIAIINYINLCTARSTDRSKEVGIRKVVGAMRRQLFVQFIGESAAITLISFVLAVALAILFLPSFNSIAGSQLTYASFIEPVFIAQVVVVLVAISLLAGVYPALLITGYKPVSVIRGVVKQPGKDMWLRRLLVVGQFCISIILVFGTLVIYNQLQYMQNKGLGYDKDNLLAIPIDPSEQTTNAEIKSEFFSTGKVTAIGRSSDLPASIQNGFKLVLQGEAEKSLLTIGMSIDDEFISTLGMKIVSGRGINASDLVRVADENSYSFILNETAVKALGITNDEAIGHAIDVDGRAGEIVGVINDFHFTSLHEVIKPLVLFGLERKCQWMFVKLNSNDLHTSIVALQDIYEHLVPSRPFQFYFLDQQYIALYTPEQRMGTAFFVFATLAIIIACLGLLGLVSFAVSQKSKEIGVRKALGATNTNIIVLVTKDYAQPIAGAILIGLPLAFWIMGVWLRSFAYKTTIGIAPLILSAAICLIVGLSTATIQALRAASIDPAKILRSD